MENKKIILLAGFLAFVCSNAFTQTTLVTGKITDKKTGQPLPFVSVQFKDSKIGTSTDINGMYRINTYYATDSLIASFIGYKYEIKKVVKDHKQIIDFQLEPSSIALNKVIIKYTGSLADRILRRVIKNKPANNREKYDDYNYNVYNKVEFDLNNITQKFENRKVFKPIKFIFNNVDTTSGEKPYLPVFISETYSNYYYRRNPKNEKEYIRGTKISGVDNKSVTQFLGDMYQNVNVYDNYINVFGKQFVSPIANFGKHFYTYYLKDTAFFDGKRCFRIDFKPKHRQSPVFEGTMWITDTTYAIKKITAKITSHTNINFIKGFKVHQEYKLVDNKYWMLKKDQLVVDFALSKKTMGVYGRKTTIYDSIKVNQPQPPNIYDPLKNVIISDSAMNRDDNFWQKARLDTLTAQEERIYHMIDTLKKVPIVKGFIDVMSTILSGYMDWGYFQVGPYFTFYSHNPIEGSRLRFGGRTSDKFSKKLEFSGHVAYGFKDQKFKYDGGYRQLLQRKNYQLLELNYSHDVEQLGQSDNSFQQDNILNSFLRREPNVKLTMVDKYKIDYCRDLFGGFSNKFILQHREMHPLGSLTYQKMEGSEIINVSNIITNEASYYLRYAYKEKFINGDISRTSLGSKYPIFEAQYTYGQKGFWNSQYEFNKLELKISGYVNLGIWGYMDYDFFGSKIWGRLPYPLLALPKGNESYFYDDEAFNLMNYFEFVGDEYAGTFLTQHFNGLFLNRIPLLRKLKWREVVGARAVIGQLSNSQKSDFLLLPEMYPLSLTKPYVEVSAGVENIFKLFRIDALWRLTYLNHPNISNFGIRGTFSIAF